ncbi:beta-1,4-galactosyltransferase galt-1-like [Engystomops pustulosus]|uniref:beta-1,4-galactosyltransferase galt-1-like n=1 Tax=Engystomops pustulosus TaxID=76066 RepID=UPI003AFAA05C
MSPLKRTFLLFCCLVLACVIFYIYSQNRLEKIIIQIYKCDVGEEAQDTITALQGNKTFIISPYYDNRSGNQVRVLGIVHHTEVKALYCYFCCDGMKLYSVKATIDLHIDRFDFPFGLADIICNVPSYCEASHIHLAESPYVNVTLLPRFEIRNRKRTPFSANFSVCLSTMYGNFSNALQFIQTMEMYKLLGAQRVTVYYINCSDLVKEILDYYSNEGTMEVVPWPIHKYLRPSNSWYHKRGDNSDIGYYGQMTTLNDCIYKNMYRSKYVLLNDLDEIILPFEHQMWDSMMEKLEQEHPDVGAFLFESHNFPQSAVTDGIFPNVSSWKDVPGFNLLNHVHREPDRPNVFNARKMIVNPRKIIQTSVHSILKNLGKTLNVPLKIALVHHCRVPHQPHLKVSQLISDRTIWRYHVSLISNVNRVLDQISSQRKAKT